MGITPIRLSQVNMTGGPNGAAILAVLQQYAPPSLRLQRMELVREPGKDTRRLYVFFTRMSKIRDPRWDGFDGAPEHISVPVRDNGQNVQTWLPHQEILAKLELIA